MKKNAKLYEKNARDLKKAVFCQTRKQKIAYGGLAVGALGALYYLIFV